MFFLSSVAFYQVSDNEGGYFHSRYGHRPQCNWASIFLGGTGSVHCLTRQLSLFLMSLTSLPRYLHSSLAEREKDVQFRFCLLPLATDPAPVWIGEQRSQRVFRRETEEVQHCSYFQCALFCTPIWLPCLFSCLLWLSLPTWKVACQLVQGAIVGDTCEKITWRNAITFLFVFCIREQSKDFSTIYWMPCSQTWHKLRLWGWAAAWFVQNSISKACSFSFSRHCKNCYGDLLRIYVQNNLCHLHFVI